MVKFFVLFYSFVFGKRFEKVWQKCECVNIFLVHQRKELETFVEMFLVQRRKEIFVEMFETTEEKSWKCLDRCECVNIFLVHRRKEIFVEIFEKSWKCLDRCGVGAASSSHSGALAVVGAGSGLLGICLKLKKKSGGTPQNWNQTRRGLNNW